MSADEERPPRVGLGLLKRAVLAGFLVVAMSATALATTVILEVDDVKNRFLRQGRAQIDIPEVTKADAGGARTILILGSDERFADRKQGLKPRSDTILLVRADPNKDALSVMSIPRDLKTAIPGHGTDKINAAYEAGGPRLTVRTIKKLFEDAGEDFPINNVININFGTFRRAVDYIGGVYVDVDRDYFNDNSGAFSAAQRYAAIDIDPGYQKLKGRAALAYVRYRHTDNDFIRAARQQDFLRQARGMAGVKKLVSVGDRRHLVQVFGRYFEVDRSFRSTKEIFSLLRLALYLIQKEPAVNEVRFRANEAPNPRVDTRLYSSAKDLRTTFHEFMSAKASSKPRQTAEPTKADRELQRVRRKRNRRAAVPGLEQARAEGVDQAVLADPKLDFPFYFPTLRTTRAAYAGREPRVYTIRDELNRKHKAYRLVVSKGLAGEYYGIQGMTWRQPPILDKPTATRSMNGRRLRLYFDGKRLRLVAWKTRRAVYWVSNTLSQSLSKNQMLAIADSMRRLRQ